MLKQSFSRAQAGAQASGQAVQNPEVQLQKLTPPVPPQAAVLADTLALDPVPLHVRQQRVANGSKRKRDLAAVQMADELEALAKRQAEEAALRAAGWEPDPCRHLRAWVRARRRLRKRLPPSTYQLWIKPLRPTGSLGECLFLTAPDGIRAWTERRYSSLIAEAVEGFGFTEVSFALPPGGEV